MQKYVIALYIRLSIEDYKYDSLSIYYSVFSSYTDSLFLFAMSILSYC